MLSLFPPPRTFVRPSSHHGPAAFSVLELLTVVFIVAILAVMALPVISKARDRAEVASCSNNLKTLYIGANSYIQEHNGWPQIAAPAAKEGHDDSYVVAWQGALAPYGVTPLTWVCPALHRLRGKPDLTLPANRSVDYLALTFDPKPRKPFEYSNMPWFAETTNAHGVGQLIIFSNGRVMGMKEAVTAFAENAGQKK